MNVKELKELLSKYPEDMKVVLSTDSGDNYATGICTCDGLYKYAPNDIEIFDLTDEDEESEYREIYPKQKDRKSHEDVVVIWPN